MLCVAGGGVAFWQASAPASSVWAMIRSGVLNALDLVSMTAVWFLAAGFCWGWGVAEAGQELRAKITLPGSCQTPALVGWVGCCAPGAGLVLAGHPERGGAVAAATGSIMAAPLILAEAPSLWQAKLACGRAGTPGVALEWILVGAAVAAVVGAFLWVVQLLDGIRLASRRTRSRAPRSDFLTEARAIQEDLQRRWEAVKPVVSPVDPVGTEPMQLR